MAAQKGADRRLAGLTKLFNGVIHGHRKLNSPQDGDRFLEALRAQEDASKCVENLIAATEGLAAVAKAFRLSGSSAFLNGPATSALRYLSDESIKQLYDGHFLHRIIEQIVEPPTFWNTFVEAHNDRLLTEDATQAFAWLLLEIMFCRSEEVPDVKDVAERLTKDESLTNHPLLEVRNLGHKIKHVIESTSSDAGEDGPGGRHDNDFADFRKVKILPTPDEFASVDRPFYRRGDAIDSLEPEQRGLAHLDNQFRLLREDLVGELRNDYQIATGAKRGRGKVILTDLEFVGIDCGIESRRKPCSVRLRCNANIPQMKNLASLADRKRYILENKNMLKHQSLGCLVSDGNIVAFATVDRDENQLAQVPPTIVLRVADDASFGKVLAASKFSQDLRFVQVATAAFAYEPILNCLQNMTDVPLEDQLLNQSPESHEASSGVQPEDVISEIADSWEDDLKHVIGTSKSVHLDKAQATSLLAGLTKRVSLIQGPPGTGKSFIGAFIAKILLDHTTETILVLTFTNHALDQYLIDLQNIGIAPSSMVRLGGRFSASTRALSISEQPNTYKMNPQTYQMIQEQKSQSEGYFDALSNKITSFTSSQINYQSLLEYLEFSEDSEFFDAFQIPSTDDGFKFVGRDGTAATEEYLLRRWLDGNDAGAFRQDKEEKFAQIWEMGHGARIVCRNRWVRELVEEQISAISNLARKYNECRARVEQLFNEKKAHILSQKRIIGCTTTGAAMYSEEIRKVSPGIVIVEEAGEILESHILTAMTANTKQLVLIGDHKQLRPKISNYALMVEKGDGYNLNQSLFERLVVAGVPHTTLNRQHRMRPEISTLIRSLTYPELEDASTTHGRPLLRGFQDNVIFVSHHEPELNAKQLADRGDSGANSSKENNYEVNMILKCLRYLGQQGYGTDRMVILTPYLGQLYNLVRTLSKDNDPVLNDLDNFELIRAGLISPAGANIAKRKIQISTIDNYQGEESDIVIVSLTRSNEACDIGFMSSPQRVNVLLSRARDALIMIGNADTFMGSRKGKEVWVPLMDQLKREGHVYEGFPVQCEKHPDRKALITSGNAFETVCPDGGCSEPCGALLNCGQHVCPQRCHQLQDHSKMHCKAIVKTNCPQNHNISRRCHDKAALTCKKCEAEARAKEQRQKRDYELDQLRQEKQRVYAAQLATLDDEIEHEKRLRKNQDEDNDRQNALMQKKQDLANLKAYAEKSQKSRHANKSTKPANPNPVTRNTRRKDTPAQSKSPEQTDPQPIVEDDTSGGASTAVVEQPSNVTASEARDDWEWQKEYEGAENEALDSLVSMIGLECVKQQFLSIKTKVDTVVRQNVSLKGERFGAALLGNPGTGKTTVARLYAKFLVKVGALPGDHFIESSGSSLANDGVSACKAHIDKLLQEGGGVLFIDEAYQLVSGNSFGGPAVLDYLLAEIENLTGKVVFVLAGYHQQMEKFFAHNPGIPGRIPIQMEFDDYSDHELQQIFCQYVSKKFNDNMKTEGGLGGLYVRIVARRIGRGRGRDGFGNAREVQNRLAHITERQAKRLRKERRAGARPDDFLLTKEDLIGPEPSSALKNNAAWIRLQKLIGLTSVKDSVRILLDGMQYNYQRELEEQPLVQYSLNRCFIGSPGTGKTSVAKLYGRILADIGLLSNGEVVVKNPADFIGDVLGASESKTKAVLASTMGKVLIIDEAYMLASGASGDPYKGAVIDTIVAEVQSTPGEDRCVLLLGYKDQMEEMFRDVNPGLARRFPLDSSFVFEDFTDPELRQILDLKLKDVGYNATDQAKKVAMETLQRARNRPNFGNAGEVDIILDRAKALHQKHLSSGKVKSHDTFEAIDFDPDFDRGDRAATNLPQLFKDVVGCEALVEQIQRYQTTAANMKALGMDPREQVPFNFLFKGPPGTGKTTTAQKMGKVFYDMGFIGQAKVIECSATDMIGQYVGQTGPKVQKLLEKALGKVLFIDEAYRLAEGYFATEAMDELVDCLTKPKFAQKLVCILAGYDKDIDRLMSINPGLTSRFPETIMFPHLDPSTCLLLLTNVFKKIGKDAKLDLTVLLTPDPKFQHRVLDMFRKLSALDSWGNARDVKSLAKGMFGKLISGATPPFDSLIVTESIVLGIMETTFKERSRRSEAVGSTRFPAQQSLVPIPLPQQHKPPTTQHSKEPATPQINTAKATKQALPQPKIDEKPDPLIVDETKTATNEGEPEWFKSIFDAKRDPNVSDAVWEQLNRDKHIAVAREREYLQQQEEKRQEEQRIKDLIRAEQEAKDEEERRLREQERIEAELERRRKELIEKKIEAQREKEKATQKRLREMGRCPMGFQWIKQGGGYRCAGGSHWLHDAQLWR